MKYILTEKQIEKLVCDVGIQPGSYGIILDDFLKSKTPVEEIAEGEVTGGYHLDEVFWLNEPISYYFEDLYSGLKGKKVRIYIEVIK